MRNCTRDPARPRASARLTDSAYSVPRGDRLSGRPLNFSAASLVARIAAFACSRSEGRVLPHRPRSRVRRHARGGAPCGPGRPARPAEPAPWLPAVVDPPRGCESPEPWRRASARRATRQAPTTWLRRSRSGSGLEDPNWSPLRGRAAAGGRRRVIIITPARRGDGRQSHGRSAGTITKKKGDQLAKSVPRPLPERAAKRAHPGFHLPGQRHQAAGPDRLIRPVRRFIAQQREPDGL
jgi:hypothetical protein